MSSGIYSALSGALAQQKALETTAHNLANASTQGYRAMRPVFNEVLGRTEAQRFTSVRQTSIDTRLGQLKETGNPLDIALPENAFLGVETPAGERFTRASALKLTPDGVLTTQTGFAVLSEAQERIVVAPDAKIEISETGEIAVDGESYGFLRVVGFNDPRQMTYEGQGLLNPNAEAGAAVPNADALGIGKIEESNASPIRAMTDLMAASRMFEAMQRAMTTYHSIDSRMVRTVPR